MCTPDCIRDGDKVGERELGGTLLHCGDHKHFVPYYAYAVLLYKETRGIVFIHIGKGVCKAHGEVVC